MQSQASLYKKHFHDGVVDTGFRDPSGFYGFNSSCDHSYGIFWFKYNIVPGFQSFECDLDRAEPLDDMVIPEVI